MHADNVIIENNRFIMITDIQTSLLKIGLEVKIGYMGKMSAMKSLVLDTYVIPEIVQAINMMEILRKDHRCFYNVLVDSMAQTITQ
jgi:hypothetical protein